MPRCRCRCARRCARALATSAAIALHPDRAPRAARQRQGEIAQAAKQVEHAHRRRLGCSSCHRRIHHRGIDLAVDLNEIDRTELDDDPAAIDGIAQSGAIAPAAAAARCRGRRSAERSARPCGAPKAAIFSRSAAPGGSMHPEHQRGRVIAGGHFHLRHFLADGERLAPARRGRAAGPPRAPAAPRSAGCRRCTASRARESRRAPGPSCART